MQNWPEECQPFISERSLARLKKKASRILYLDMLLRFLTFVVNLVSTCLDAVVSEPQSVVNFAARFIVSLSNSHVRTFHSVYAFFFPGFSKARLTAELKGAEHMHVAQHTTPITKRLVRGLAKWMLPRYGRRPAAGVLVEFATMMRTAEASQVRRGQVLFRTRTNKKTTIRLGDTKAGREQYVELEPNSFAERILRFACEGLQPTELVFNMTYQMLYGAIQAFLRHFAILLTLTPHSLRAGEATRRKMLGEPLHAIQEAGRWEHPKTCKTYIDVVFARQPLVLQEESKVPLLNDENFANILAPCW